MRARVATDEHGAETLEFALVFPVVAILVLGLLYGLLAVAAHVSLAHATSRAVRYASIPVDPVAGVYPSPIEVEAHLDEHTPFFGASSCETTLTGEARQNAPVALDVRCEFPNPAGGALNGFRSLFRGEGVDVYADTLTMTANAVARRE